MLSKNPLERPDASTILRIEEFEPIKKKMNTNLIPLNDKEEAILKLMQRINELEYENSNLKDEIKQLKWSLQEHD